MKTFNCSEIRLMVGLCCVLASSVTMTEADEVPPLSQIVAKAAKAIMPSQSYSATVHQTVSKSNPPGQSGGNGSPATNEIEEADFVVLGDKSGALRAKKKGLSLKRSVQNSAANPVATDPVQNLRLILTVNPVKALHHIENSHSAEVSADLYKDIPCFKLSATDGHIGLVVWVRKSDMSVCHQIILEDSNILLEAHFDYKNWSNCLVPTRVVITKPADNTRVEQQFSDQTF